MWVLLYTSFLIGLMHTAMGPDHYVPFIVMSRARRWNMKKTLWITLLCGIGHVGSAVALGWLAVLLGFTLTKLSFIETFRASIATWMLIIFGFLYFIWGVRSALKNKKHSHWHLNHHGEWYQHDHIHDHDKTHRIKTIRELTPWILFTIFILGPCEPLIPLILYPAMSGKYLQVFVVSLLFGAATILTMISIVLSTVFGMQKLKFTFLERYGNALAGALILMSGLAIKFLGL